MTPAFKHFQQITSPEVRGKYAALSRSVPNFYVAGEHTRLPILTLLLIEVASSVGLYAIADIDGKLTKVLIRIEDFDAVQILDMIKIPKISYLEVVL